MSRNEGRIGTGDDAAVNADEILAQIERDAARLPRPVAVARYLSASEGWREASTELRGAFAPATD
ncbi:MAG: hypothetical protein M3428_05670 [Pseudomonadota bacterium]|jgi:hypothetical protein|nr:hypothetical protein [Pseudomonadota bacterium]